MLAKFIFDSDESSLKDTLKRSKKLVSGKIGIIKTLTKNAFYTDEPKFYQYTAQLCDVALFSDVHTHDKFVGGMSLDNEHAMVKAIGEAIERYSLSVYKSSNFICETFENIKNAALSPSGIVAFSKHQMKTSKFRNFRVDDHSKLYWTIGYSIFKEKCLFVPAQLVYVPYRYKNEKIIRLPITTGAASGSSLTGALIRGICEVVERDAYIINYLNKLPGKLVNINELDNKNINKMLAEYRNCDIEVYVFDITTDLNIPTMMCILIDRSKEGPAVSVGLKCHLDPYEAIIGCLEEAQHARPWIRAMMINGKPMLENTKKKMKLISTVKDRGILWSDVNMINKLDFWLKKNKYIKIKNKFSYSQSAIKNLRLLLNILKNKVSDIIYVDVTTRDVRETGFKVVKVIIPELQPLYLDEQYKYLGGRRLYEFMFSKRLNDIPHPFL